MRLHVYPVTGSYIFSNSRQQKRLFKASTPQIQRQQLLIDSMYFRSLFSHCIRGESLWKIRDRIWIHLRLPVRLNGKKRSENDFSLPFIWQCNTIRTARVSAHKNYSITHYSQKMAIGRNRKSICNSVLVQCVRIHFHVSFAFTPICWCTSIQFGPSSLFVRFKPQQRRLMSMWNMIG